MIVLASGLQDLMERNAVLHVVSAWVFAIVLIVVGCRLIKQDIANYLTGKASPRDTVFFSLIVFAGGVISLVIAVMISFVAPRITFW